ncbi:PTS sugar transporter subunit IIC [Schleiferilactobacillus harbinensis]|uniref:Permease IIC component n=1 Tax=Schleiferilactobacillus harbinensis TaxID=304207 RepID=A0ABU7T3E6_9LACO
MTNSGSTLGTKFQVIMGKFSTNQFLSAIANGMIRILPITMVGSLCAILANLGFPGYKEFVERIGVSDVLTLGVTMTTNLISVYVLVALAYELAKNLNESSISAIVISVMSFFILTPLNSFKVAKNTVSALDISYLGSKGMFVAMVVALFTTWLYSFLTKKHITITLPASVPPSVANSFSALIPAIIIGGLDLVIAGIMRATSFGNVHDLVYTLLQTPLQHIGGSIWALLFLMFFSEVLWFFGIHGSLATSAILYTLYQPLELENLAAFAHGQALPNIITMTFVNTLKGPRHFALALLLLLICHSQHMKAVGKVAIVPSFFGISEPMKFGIPMVLNPVLFVPMALAPVISIGLAYITTILGWIPRVNGVTFPWNIPFLSGLVVGDWRTGVLQLVQVAVVMVLYYPFIRILDRESLTEEAQFAKEAAV